MATSLAETYYLKAVEHYPWELSEALENLNYALSYDEDYAPAHCMMGKLQLTELQNTSEAQYHFERAIMADPKHICAYANLIGLYINLKDYGAAQKALDYTTKLPMVSRTYALRTMAQILEHQGSIHLSRKYLKEARRASLNWREYNLLDSECKRLKKKTKLK